MLAKGFLAGNSIYVCTEHTPEVLNEYFEVLDGIFKLVSECENGRDIKKLLKSFNSLLDNGHSIIVVEHNLDLIKCSDNVIDLGPDGGENGGNLIFNGSPKKLMTEKKSRLKKYLELKF